MQVYKKVISFLRSFFSKNKNTNGLACSCGGATSVRDTEELLRRQISQLREISTELYVNSKDKG